MVCFVCYNNHRRHRNFARFMLKGEAALKEFSTSGENPEHAYLPPLDRTIVPADYRIVHRSRMTSIIARQEVFSGKAKFGIFGDGKEVAQVAMAHAFRKGDFRSGYYRDQTLMFALGILTLPQFFAQLYGHADLEAEPNFCGRAMTGHFATRLLNLMNGVYICVPRDATQAAGFYNTLLKSDDSALIIETLNAYRIKAVLPDNIGEFCIPLGIPEILREGTDLTIITYRACCAIAMEASGQLEELVISVEIIDARTLIPFDSNGAILNSLKKTNRILFLDEDFPGGATAFMMQQVIERQGGFQWLDSPPRTLSAKEHRPAYGSDGDYFSKPNREQIIEAAYKIMRESDPIRFPDIFAA